MQRLAIYDLDRTITRFPTYLPFLTYALRKLQPWRIIFIPVAMGAAFCYAFGLIDRRRIKELNFRLFLGPAVEAGNMERIVHGFAGRNLSRNTLKGALDRIAEDRAEGYRVVLATASFAFYVRAYAAMIGVEDVIATGARIENGKVRARLDGENCFGPAKLRMVAEWLSDQGIPREDAHVRFYSDHVSDQYCLDWADEAYATNPHRELRLMAEERGWKVLEWRGGGIATA